MIGKKNFRIIGRLLLVLLFYFTIAVIFAYFQTRLSIYDRVNFSEKIKDVYGETTVNLPEKDKYLLKIWGDDDVKEVRFNGTPIIHRLYRNREKPSQLKEFYYTVPFELTHKGTNTLTIDPPERFTLKFKNNIVDAKFGGIFFKDQRVTFGNFPETFWRLWPLLVAGGAGIYIFISLIIPVSIKRFLASQGVIFIPFLLVCLVLHKAAALAPFQLLFIGKTFVQLFFSLIIIGEFLLLSALIFSSFSRISQGLKNKGTSIKKEVLDGFAGLRAVKYFLDLEFADKCMIAAACLLLLATVTLSFGLEPVAKLLGDAIFLLFVIGAAIRLRKLISSRKS